MPPRPHSSSSYIGVREHPSGTYYVEIRSGDVGLGLGTFETAHEAARAFDAAAWRLGRPRAQMNFQDVYTREQAQNLAPPPYLITEQDRQSTVGSSAGSSSPRRTSESWRSGAGATRRTSPPRTPTGRRGRQGVTRSGRTCVITRRFCAYNVGAAPSAVDSNGWIRHVVKAVPPWCNNKIPCYQQIISKWINPEWRATHTAASKRRALMGGPVHLQGNLNLHAYVQKKNRERGEGEELLNTFTGLCLARKSKKPEGGWVNRGAGLRINTYSDGSFHKKDIPKLAHIRATTSSSGSAIERRPQPGMDMLHQFNIFLLFRLFPTFSSLGEGSNNFVVAGCTPSQASPMTRALAQDALTFMPQ
ncbi:putative AP2 protein [Hordeum vulgare]|nr:putative AP2 protein [Hordeum vulgare]